MSHEFQTFLSSRGVTHQTSVPHMPQQNGRAERFNRTILEKAEAMCQVCSSNISGVTYSYSSTGR